MISNEEYMKRENALRTYDAHLYNKIFVYGILKRGHALDMTHMGGKYLYDAIVNGKLYHIGHGVGLKLATRLDDNSEAHGEVWEIPATLWQTLDEIESEGRAYARVWTKVEHDGERVEVQCYEHIYYPDDWYGTRLPEIEGGKFV